MIPQLREALSKYSVPVQSATSSTDVESGSKALTAAVRDLYRMMDNEKSKSYGSVIPLIMIQVLILHKSSISLEYYKVMWSINCVNIASG